MTGWFALGATDPVAGAREGQQQRTKLYMHAAIRITDLAAFVGDTQHRGSISGTVDFTPIGRDLRADVGEFRLFAPDASGGKRMVYSLDFERAGEQYRLAGEKHVLGGSVLRMWPETTTLHTRLEQRTSGRPEVIGAGILRIDMLGMLAMLNTLRGTANTGMGRVGALARFGGFFGSELWDSYVMRRPVSRDRA